MEISISPCVGCADRSAYDLTVHSAYTGSPLIVKEALSEPVKVEEWQATLDQKLIGPRFKKDAKVIQSAVEALDQPTLERLASEIAVCLSTLRRLVMDGHLWSCRRNS